jgi:hypothetical protein
MLAEVFTGHHPFESDRHILFAITHMEADLPTDLPLPFADIIQGCLVKKRSMRWTAPQVLAALNTTKGLRATLSAYRWSFNQVVHGGNGKEKDKDNGSGKTAARKGKNGS